MNPFFQAFNDPSAVYRAKYFKCFCGRPKTSHSQRTAGALFIVGKVINADMHYVIQKQVEYFKDTDLELWDTDQGIDRVCDDIYNLGGGL